MKCCLCHEDKPEPWLYICVDCSSGIMREGPYKYLRWLWVKSKTDPDEVYCSQELFDAEFARRALLRGIEKLPLLEDRLEAMAWLSLELAVELRAPKYYLQDFQGVLEGVEPSEFRTRKLFTKRT